MSCTQRHDINGQLCDSSSEGMILHVDDPSFEYSHELSADYCQQPDNCHRLYPSEDSAALYSQSPDKNGFQLDDQSAIYLPSPDDVLRQNVSTHSKVSNSKQTRNNLELDQRSSRRSSVQSSRSRTNSYSRPTSLGNGRRGSGSRRTKSRRMSTTRRKDSVRPVKTEAKEALKIAENVQELEQARRHRRITMIVLGTFLFLLAASVLVVVVTLTHSTFLSPAIGSKELAEHRARLRRENEELLNSLNRVFVAENSTVPP